MRLAALTLVAIVFCAVAQNDSTSVRTNFHPDAILSSSEIQSVIKLVNQRGITRVAEVSTHNIHPSPRFFIRVKGVETVKGRDVSFATVSVMSERWMDKPKGRKTLNTHGKFWVERILTNTLTTFTARGNTIRVQLSGDVPLAMADKIVDAFAEGKVQYANHKFRKELEDINFTQPIALGRASDKKPFGISFSCGDLCVYWVDFTFEGDVAQIIGVEKWVS